MITITNGVKTCDVPTGAYNSVYKNQGWYPVNADKKKYESEEKYVDEEETDVSGTSSTEEATDYSYLIEKPIGAWTKEEVAQFVKENEIDTKGATKVQQVKNIVKKWIEENA